MTTLEDLYYGNIAPHERYIRHGSREEKVLKLLCRNEESLTKNLNNRQKKYLINSLTAKRSWRNHNPSGLCRRVQLGGADYG